MGKDLKTLLTNPFDGKTDFQNECMRIANDLFSNYGIKCGNKIFRFAEIEFYYYKKDGLVANANWDKDWNKETYPRNKKAGELFFHYSGVDVCFECNYEEKERDNEDGEFGGILIRSLFDGQDILAGPLFCSNTMLNACIDSIPKVIPINEIAERIEYKEGDIQTRRRFGIQSDKDTINMPFELCFYVASINGKQLDWSKTSKRIGWDKKDKKFRKKSRNYKKDRGL